MSVSQYGVYLYWKYFSSAISKEPWVGKILTLAFKLILIIISLDLEPMCTPETQLVQKIEKENYGQKANRSIFFGGTSNLFYVKWLWQR